MKPIKWIRVDKQKPCKICEKPDWCGYSDDGAVAICMRVESGRKSRNGGWVHLLKDKPLVPQIRRPEPPSQEHKLFDVARYYESLRRQWCWDYTEACGFSLGVDFDVIDALEPAWDSVNEAFAWPMRDFDGRVIGIRLRAWDGKKWAVRGGNDGLFFPVGAAYPGRELVVCEGPTDTCAALSMGLPAVGRASCMTGGQMLREYCRMHKISRVTIISDNDKIKSRPDGTGWRPGREGAKALGNVLGRMWRMVTPPTKDMRAWYHDGCTPELFADVAGAQRWQLPV